MKNFIGVFQNKSFSGLNVFLYLIVITLASFDLFFSTTIQAQTAPGKGYKEIKIDSSYSHTKWGIEPADLVYNFSAYTTSFDSDDDNNDDGKGDIWGIPEWVAYEVKMKVGTETQKYDRPKWMTDDNLNKRGIAPNDATYAVSGTRELKEVSGDYRYVRGHMCPKDAADRISMEAGYNTHTVLNAVPQLQWQNNGIWKSLESQITDWADKYNEVWVICGPVFFDRTPSVWLGQDKEVKAAVPDAIFKIVIRETDSNLESLAFIVPNVIPKEKKDYSEYLTSISRIESLTGLTFLTNLDENVQIIEKAKRENQTSAQKKFIVDQW